MFPCAEWRISPERCGVARYLLREAAEKVENNVDETLTYRYFSSEHWTWGRALRLLKMIQRSPLSSWNSKLRRMVGDYHRIPISEDLHIEKFESQDIFKDLCKISRFLQSFSWFADFLILERVRP